MARNKRPYYEKVKIEDVGAEGKAIARPGNLVVFTSYVIPGDVVDLQVTRKRKKYQEANVVKIHAYSPDRVPAFCSHFGICGGCKWQFLPYQKQLFYKQKQVADQLKRIGKTETGEINPILGSSNEIFYRNKLEFTFSNRRWFHKEELDHEEERDNPNALGFHIPGLFDKVINIEKCWLQPSPSNEIRNFIYGYAHEKGLEFFDIRNKSGFLRNLIIRTSTKGEVMVILSFYKEEKRVREELLNVLKQQFQGITSLMYVINPKANDTITDQEIICYCGRDYILEEMEGLTFKIGPKSFYQTNAEQALELYRIVRNFTGLKGDEVVYDLYTGTGTIALFLAGMAKKVVGIEYVPEAIRDAKENATINRITNAEFYSGDIKQVLDESFLAQNGMPDVIVTDPPRAGMHEDVVRRIIGIGPSRVVYVSCNPATQARDLALFSEDYRISEIQPVDMFPHTHHVENVVLLTRVKA